MTGLASVFATAATIAAALYAAGAYNAALRTLGETRKQAEAAAEANRIGSRALAAAVGASVHFGHGEFRMFTDARETPKINLVVPITNVGGTTTQGLTRTVVCTDSVRVLPDPFDRARLNAVRPDRITLGPKETGQPVVCSYTLQEWARITAQRGNIYAYGEARYRDTINPSEVHRLEFCFRLYDLGFTSSTFNPGPHAQSEECEKHNCNDEDCQAQR